MGARQRREWVLDNGANVLDNGAKWKDLPRRFGSKSAVHRWFSLWVREGVFDAIMRVAGELVEERNGFSLYKCFIDATFSKARGGGDGVGVTKAGKCVKVMVVVDARGLPISVTTGSASPQESKLVQGMFEFMLTLDAQERIIGGLRQCLRQRPTRRRPRRRVHRADRAAPQQSQAGKRHTRRPPAEAIQTPLDG